MLRSLDRPSGAIHGDPRLAHFEPGESQARRLTLKGRHVRYKGAAERHPGVRGRANGHLMGRNSPQIATLRVL